MAKHTSLPLTVKTRLGWDHDSIKIVEVAERLQDVGAKAISIHGGPAQMYKGDADWKPIAEVKNNPRMHIPVFGNGDVDSPERPWKCATVMVWMVHDREGQYRNPWFLIKSNTILKKERIVIPT